jgi:hypothetical protein
MWPVGGLEAEELLRPATYWVQYTTSCIAQSNAPEDEQSNCPKHVELIGIINKQLLLHLVGCLLYYLYQRLKVKQILNTCYLFKQNWRSQNGQMESLLNLFHFREQPSDLTLWNECAINNTVLLSCTDSKEQLKRTGSYARKDRRNTRWYQAALNCIQCSLLYSGR